MTKDDRAMLCGMQADIGEIKSDVKVHLKHHEYLDNEVRTHRQSLFGWGGIISRLYLLFGAAAALGSILGAKVFGLW